jgi:hypothetical protein
LFEADANVGATGFDFSSVMYVSVISFVNSSFFYASSVHASDEATSDCGDPFVIVVDQLIIEASSVSIFQKSSNCVVSWKVIVLYFFFYCIASIGAMSYSQAASSL